MKKVLIHLGLPKTATSTLQQNVFQVLHNEGKINFLGKNLEVNEITGKVTIYNYEGKYIRDAIEEKICLEEAAVKLNSDLVGDKLNIFSDEGIMVAYPGMENLPLKRKINNLKKLLQPYDVKVVITLRDPIDYLYSLYVQLHPDFYSQIKKLNSVTKFAEKLINEPNDTLFESFFYDEYLPYLSENFDLEVMYFEDLNIDKVLYYKAWACLLGVDTSGFKILFEKKHVNQKKKTAKGTKKIVSLKFIENTAREFLKNIKPLFVFSKFVYNYTHVKKLLNRRVSIPKVHEKPIGKQLSQLNQVLYTKYVKKYNH